jgi:hypothetical protein
VKKARNHFNLTYQYHPLHLSVNKIRFVINYYHNSVCLWYRVSIVGGITVSSADPSLNIPSPITPANVGPPQSGANSTVIAHIYTLFAYCPSYQKPVRWTNKIEINPTLSALPPQDLCCYRPSSLQISPRSITPLSPFLIRRPFLPRQLPALLGLTANL